MEHSEITIRGATFTVCHEQSESITADDITAIYCDGADDLLKLFQPYDKLIAEFVGEVNHQLRLEREADDAAAEFVLSCQLFDATEARAINAGRA